MIQPVKSGIQTGNEITMAGPGPGSKRTQFKPGVSGNPKGAPKKNKVMTKFQEMTYAQFIERLQKFGALNKEEIKKIINEKDTQVLDLVYCRHLWDAVNGKDRARESLYNRLWGKVREQIEHFGVNQSQIIVTIPSNGREVEIAKGENETDVL